jgi:tRNA threonylcarbamoyladenosine biosynthesis protein TsaE
MSEITKHCQGVMETEAFGKALGTQLKGGEVIELRGDLGAGKTTLVRGLVRGLNSLDQVASPTYTLSKVYRGRLRVHHFDFYRLTTPDFIIHELGEVMHEPDGVTIIEWADAVIKLLPEKRIVITITAPSAEERTLVINVPESFAYLMETA